MNVLRKLNIGFLTVLFISLSYISQAQDINSAGQLFNEGIKAVKAKEYTSAIEKLQSGLDMCKTLGAPADELKGKIVPQLVKAHLKKSIKLYKGKKFDEAVAAFTTTKKVATELGDSKTAKKADKLIPNVYVDKAKALLKAKKHDEALAAIDQSVAIKAKNPKAMFVQGLIYKDQDNLEKAGASFTKAMEQDAKGGKYGKKSQKAAGKMFEAAGARELQLEHTQKAINYLTEAVKYNTKSDNSYYMLAVAYNKIKDYDKAITSAKAGLAIKGSRSVTSTNFELGKAYEGKGDNTSACAAYKKVTSGPNAQAAAYQIKEVLKCN